MDLAVFYQIIVPLLEMRQAVLIMISTPTGTWSFYNHLFNLVLPSTGEKLFNTVSVELVCPRCLRTERAEHCRHNLHKIPDWKDSDKLDVVKLIYGDRTTTLKRESLGMTADDVNPIIRREFITDLRERPLWVPDYDVVPKFVHIVVDPNAGGDNGFALTALVYLNGQVIICGLDSHPVKPLEDCDRLFESFCDGIFNHPWLRSEATRKILTVERNTGREAGRLVALFRRRGPSTYCVREKPTSDYGWWTSVTSKNQYTQQLWIKMAEGGIYYLDTMVCVNPWMDPVSRRERTVAEFEAQCSRFQPVNKEGKDPFQTTKTTTSGKVGHDGQLQKGVDDDLAMSLAMNLYITMRLQTRQIRGIDYTKLLGDANAYRGVKRSTPSSEQARQDADKRQRKQIFTNPKN